MVVKLRSWLRGFVARTRVRKQLLRYAGVVLSALPTNADLPVSLRLSVSRLEKHDRRVVATGAELRWLMRFCHGLRALARSGGVRRLEDVLAVETVFSAGEGRRRPAAPRARDASGWSEREKQFFLRNMTVRRWAPAHLCHPPLKHQIDLAVLATSAPPERTGAGGAKGGRPPTPRPPEPASDARGRGSPMGRSWEDADGVATVVRGIRLAWGNLAVYGYLRDTPIGLLDATFPHASARARHVQRLLRGTGSLDPAVRGAVVADLAPRQILAMRDEHIRDHALALQQSVRRDADSSLRTLARDIERLSPVELIRHIYSLVATTPDGRPRTLSRIMFEFICVRNVRSVPSVAATIRLCLPPRLREVVCKRMVGLTSDPTAGPASSSSAGSASASSSASCADLPLPEQVRLRFADEHPAVFAAARDRLREYSDSRPGSDTQNKAAQYLTSLLRLPLGRVRVHPSVAERHRAFSGKSSTAAVDRRLRVSEHILTTLHVRKGGPFPPVPTQAWREHWDGVRKFRALRRRQRAALVDADAVMEETVYGCKPAKRMVRQLVAQWVGNDAGGCVIGLEGPPGVGKTTLVREGLARCFGTRDAPHPFEFISLGGSTNNSTLVGWTYTWHTSSFGKIAGALMRHGVMNPIIYFDELDKVSRTNEGREIIGILTHLTDSSQNTEFEDRYFAGVPLDLSRCIIVFSYNDASAIDPVLLDRVQRIRIDAMTTSAKVAVAQQFVLPKICAEVGVETYRHRLPDRVVHHIAQRYTREAGVRRLKELLYTIVRERNRQYLIHDRVEPIVLASDAERILADARPSRIDRVGSSDESAIGAINALHAGAGGGGVTPVQVVRISAGRFRAGSGATGEGAGAPVPGRAGPRGPKRLEDVPAWRRVAPRILLTGQQGAVMMEAAHVAATLAAILAGTADPEPAHFHLHCPDGGTPKDGPSAGVAFTLAFLSVLTKRPIRQNLALTGEIDLLGRVRVIGGVSEKITGALLHGVEIILMPEGNRDDAEKFLATNPLPPGACIHYISTVQEAIKLALKK